MGFMSPETRKLHARMMVASQAGGSPDLPEAKHRYAVSAMGDRIRKVFADYGPMDGLDDLDKRVLTDAFHKALDDAPKREK